MRIKKFLRNVEEEKKIRVRQWKSITKKRRKSYKSLCDAREVLR